MSGDDAKTKSAQPNSKPFTGQPGDLGAAPEAHVDPMADITRRINAAQQKLKEQAAETKRRFDEARKRHTESEKINMEGKRERPDNPDAGIVDDKMAEARERAGRIDKEAGTTSDKAQDAAVDTEDRQNERDAARSENDKAAGNGDDAIEDAVLAGKPAGAPRQ